MIRGIGYIKVEISEQEYEYYKQLIKRYTDDNHKGSNYFVNLFETDSKNRITIIKPTKSIPWEILFFVQNLMINQHMRSYDIRIKQIEDRLES